MRVVFMGTPAFAATILEELARHHEVVAAYTRPDAVRGRGKRLEPSPVKALAEQLGIEARTPRTLRDAGVQAELAALAPDVACVAAYGMLLPPEVLAIPRLGCVNVHASLLPRWRGAAPVERAILAGDVETGVSLMRMEEGLDTGPYCVQRSIPIAGKAAPDLADELANLGARGLLTALELLEAGEPHWTSQDEADGVTYAAKLERGELDLAPDATALQNVRRVQASSEAHAARCAIGGRPVSVLEAAWVVADDGRLDPEASEPRVASADLPLLEELDCGEATWMNGRLYLACAHTESHGDPEEPSNLLEVVRLKPDGKRAMEAKAFAAGMPALRDGNVRWESVGR